MYPGAVKNTESGTFHPEWSILQEAVRQNSKSGTFYPGLEHFSRELFRTNKQTKKRTFSRAHIRRQRVKQTRES